MKQLFLLFVHDLFFVVHCGFVLFVSYLSWTSVHLVFLQWTLGGIFDCLLFTVCIAGRLCLCLQVHLYLKLLSGGWGWCSDTGLYLLQDN